MDLDLIRTFAAVAEHGGFTAAAARLRVPKSSVSRQVARLEAQLGRHLLRRTTRRVSLTDEGAALHERVTPLLRSLEQALGELPARGGEPRGRLRVTAPTDLGAAFLADLAVRFTARHPAVELDVVLTNRLVDLVAEGFDAALRAGAGRMRDSSLVARRLCALDILLFAAPSYLARRRPPRAPADLAGHDWVVFGSTRALTLAGPGGEVVVEPRGRVRGDDFWFVREAARAGGGLALLPWFLAAEDVAAGRLVRVLPRHAVRGATLWFVQPPARHPDPKLTAFRDFVVAALRAVPLAAGP